MPHFFLARQPECHRAARISADNDLFIYIFWGPVSDTLGQGAILVVDTQQEGVGAPP